MSIKSVYVNNDARFTMIGTDHYMLIFWHDGRIKICDMRSNPILKEIDIDKLVNKITEFVPVEVSDET